MTWAIVRDQGGVGKMPRGLLSETDTGRGPLCRHRVCRQDSRCLAAQESISRLKWWEP